MRRLHVAQTHVAYCPEAPDPGSRLPQHAHDLLREGVAGRVDHGNLQLFLRTKVREDAALAYIQGCGEPRDRQPVEPLDRRESRMQVELLDRRRWKTRIELANAIFEYLEIWHNWQRRHSRLGMLTPAKFENRQLILGA